MRHLVGLFLIAGVLGGCSMSTVGSMEPEDGAPCDTPMETKQGADGCSECTCDGSTWSCEDDACTATCTAGETKTADDGCNTCSCAMGSWACTTDKDCSPMACQPGDERTNGCTSCTCAMDGAWDCQIDDDCVETECEQGETKLGDGGCYRCDCDDTGHWSCPDIECMKCMPGETSVSECLSCECNEEGTWTCTGFFDGVCAPKCTPGTMMPAGDGCNTCACQNDGTLACTMVACEPLVCDPGAADCDGDPGNGCEVDVTSSPDNCGSCGLVCMARAGEAAICTAGTCSSSGDQTCLYQGVEHPVGSSFPARDGCNVCECVDDGMRASVSCTDLGCACEPALEASYRHYEGGPDSCVPLGYTCPEFTTAFENGCGCGCEQSVECPATYKCPPDGTMSQTCAELEVRCPYTELSSGP